MATAGQIVNRALRMIGVLDANEAPEANMAQDALDTLNAMLAEWHEADIALPDYSLASLTTDLASDVADREAIAYQLGGRIAPEYGRALPRELVEIASQTMGRLRLRYFQPGKADLSELPSARSSFNMEAGE